MMNQNQNQTEADAEAFRTLFLNLSSELEKRIVGQREIIEGVLVALLVGGHVLLEGVPGLGKTMLVRTLAEVADLEFSRIQFTPDLMPSDIVGTNLIAGEEGTRMFEFQPGPIFANLVLADEINRATPKTQSALLEAMQEHHVTVGGRQHPLSEPFLVLATQNPLEMEGTYPLPEAQLDRFLFKLKVAYPSADELHTILDRTTGGEHAPLKKVSGDAAGLLRWRAFVREVPMAREVQERAVQIVLATHPDRPEASEKAKRYVRYGASPRGAQALILAGKIYALLDGRFHVSRADLERAVLPALRHRVLLNFEGEAEGISTDEILCDIVSRV
ncbi:MAG TPA: MoxR family ATPase [Chthoniobacteraceae bacterium]|nr:MoxR family ATPase [Chthoniobacteraceae bacterium]